MHFSLLILRRVKIKEYFNKFQEVQIYFRPPIKFTFKFKEQKEIFFGLGAPTSESLLGWRIICTIEKYFCQNAEIFPFIWRNDKSALGLIFSAFCVRAAYNGKSKMKYFIGLWMSRRQENIIFGWKPGYYFCLDSYLEILLTSALNRLHENKAIFRLSYDGNFLSHWNTPF